MDINKDQSTSHMTDLKPNDKELYYLIAKFLASGPCKKAGQELIRELQINKIIPNRIDWRGNSHEQSYNEYDKKFSHLPNAFLSQLVNQVSHLGQIAYPQVPIRPHSLLTKSLLRSTKDDTKPFKNSYEVTRSRYYRTNNNRPSPNTVLGLMYRESWGFTKEKQFLTNNYYSRFSLLSRKVGHLSAVYCLLYDRLGRNIITGADDALIKIWSVLDGRLLATLRGASSEISDLDVDQDNMMIAAGSCDRVIRVWNLQTLSPIAILTSHTGTITSVAFCPSPSNKGILVSTGADGCVAFWFYSIVDGAISFEDKPLKMNERVRPGRCSLICLSFSTGGNFLAIGSADHFVRVYHLRDGSNVDKLLELEVHQDRVDSIQWCHSGVGFVSGSRDGSALIWKFMGQQWKTLKLSMTEVLPGISQLEEDLKRLHVTMVGWDKTDAYVITASSDKFIRIWEAKTGKLRYILQGHEDNVFVIEPHPTDERYILTAGHDGQIIIWNIERGNLVKRFKNTIEGQGYGSIFDAKWQPDGFGISATDSHGHIILFGIGDDERFKKVPEELFFHTDYRPLIRDNNNFVLDEQTQIAPHLMPPPFLVNIDGIPYPPVYQRLVPGREKCRNDQLIPNVVLNDDGEHEVLDMSFDQRDAPEQNSVEDQENRPNIDQMIERLALQNQRLSNNSNASNQGQVGGNPDHSYAVANNPDPTSPRAGRVGARRAGDVEGVRQSTGNWERGPSLQMKNRNVLRKLSPSAIEQNLEMKLTYSTYELEEYDREMRNVPDNICLFKSPTQCGIEPVKKRPRKRKQTHAYSTRANIEETNTADTSHDRTENSNSLLSMDNDGTNEEADLQTIRDAQYRDLLGSNESEGSGLSRNVSSDSDSSEYSDWTADAGINLEPPKRTAHKQKRSVQITRRTRANKAQQESDEEEIEEKPKEDKGPVRRGKRRAKKVAIIDSDDEMPEEYKPPEWLCETVPKKAPYFPQMGDQLIYFQQGHQLYVEAVINRKLYNIDIKTLPWRRKYNLREQEYVKIIGMKYEIKPPRLCCLKLGILDPDGTFTGDSFIIKYHDMPDVLDFLVLKPAYDIAVSRNWQPNDRFRCIIDDAWWFGTVECQEPHLLDFPDSVFLCYKVVWDNGERERLSPWDMEPIDIQTGQPEIGSSIRVRPKEYKSLLYTNWSEDWNDRPFKSECKRIAGGISKVMELSAAEPFLAPVDLNAYPTYACIIEYPMDLSMIKSRLENHFYRSPNSVQFDVRYIATNAEKFNKKGSIIVKNARIITDLCLRIIKDASCTDPTPYYHEVQANYTSPIHSDDEFSSRRRRDIPESNWRQECTDLLKICFEREDSTPFRQPVNVSEYEDYNEIVDCPIDLATIKEELETNSYSTPFEFTRDMRLIFANSKNYNTNKRSRIYSMTVRLEAYFEEKIKDIMNAYKAQGKALKNTIYGGQNQRISLHLTRTVNMHNDTVESIWVAKDARETGPFQVNGYSSSEDDEDGDDDSAKEGKRRSKRLRKMMYRFSENPGPSGIRNSFLTRDISLPSTSGEMFNRRPGRYECDSDFEAPVKKPPVRISRRNSISSISRPRRSCRLENGAEPDYDESESEEEQKIVPIKINTVMSEKKKVYVTSDAEIPTTSENTLDLPQTAVQSDATAPATSEDYESSSPEPDARKDSEFEIDEDEFDDSDYEVRPKKKTPIKQQKRTVVKRGRKAKQTVLDGDDVEDQDFIAEESEVLSYSSSSSSESTRSNSEDNDSDEKNSKRKVKKLESNEYKRRIQVDINTPPKKRRKRKKIVHSTPVSKKPHVKKTNGVKHKKNIRPSLPSVEVHREGKLIGRVITKAHKLNYSDSDPEYADHPNIRQKLKRTNFVSTDSEDDWQDNKRRSGDKEVGRRGRVRKKVKYNEEDSDEADIDFSGVSSRGRVIRTNTRMKDFI